MIDITEMKHLLEELWVYSLRDKDFGKRYRLISSTTY